MELAFFDTISSPSIPSEVWTHQVTLHCLFSWTRVCEDHGRSAPDSCGGTPGIFKDSNNHCWKTAAGVQEALLQSWVWHQEGLPGQNHLCQVGMCSSRWLLRGDGEARGIYLLHIRNSSSFLMETAVKETILIIASKQLPANAIVAVCRLFEWLVLVINENIYTDPSVWTSFIGMDIPTWFNSGASSPPSCS